MVVRGMEIAVGPLPSEKHSRSGDYLDLFFVSDHLELVKWSECLSLPWETCATCTFLSFGLGRRHLGNAREGILD